MIRKRKRLETKAGGMGLDIGGGSTHESTHESIPGNIGRAEVLRR